jgi:hypothetical protein
MLKNIKSIIFFLILMASCISHAQFVDNFDSDSIKGWFCLTGDGAATMKFVQEKGYATMIVDATKDKYNIYWTTIKRDVSSSLDLSKLKDTTYQLRVEAKVRVHDAPRRLNTMVNTQRTKNYHIDLMEFEINDTTDWHIISMTTKRFDAVPGDTVYVQLCATDYGLGKYNVDIDYYRANIVNVREAGPDKGELIPYHPPMPGSAAFSEHLDVAQDCLINSDFPEVNFNDWQVKEEGGESYVLTINANQWAILKWDFKKYMGRKADGPGLLELTTQSAPQGGKYIEAYGEEFGIEFGKIRTIEITGGDPDWDQTRVTYNNFVNGKDLAGVFNSQMIFDTDVSREKGGKNFITISRPVLQRLIDGQTKGLLIRPLGSLDPSFYASENRNGKNVPKLHFNLKK